MNALNPLVTKSKSPKLRKPIKSAPGSIISSPQLDAKQMHLITRALADPRRFEIFERIAASPRYVSCSDLREAVDISAATMSHHLKELENAGLINAIRDGKFMNLSLCRGMWKAYIAALKKL